jgi:putative nucleotidyltransferase with HDIG domain
MSQATKILRKVRDYFQTGPRKRRPIDYFKPLERWLVLLIMFGIALLLIAPTFYFEYYDFAPDQAVNETIKSPFSITVTDEEATEHLRKKAEDTYTRYYEYNSHIVNDAKKRVRSILAQLDAIGDDESLDDTVKSERGRVLLKDKFGIEIDISQVEALLVLVNNEQTLQNFYAIFEEIYTRRGVITDLYAYQSFERRDVVQLDAKAIPPPQPIHSGTMLAYPEGVREFLNDKLIPRFYPKCQQQEAIFALVSSIVQPNIYMQQTKTNHARRDALNRVGYVELNIKKGDVVIKRGDVPTSFQKSAIEEINRRARRFNLFRLIGDAAFVIAVFVFVFLYVRKISPDYTFSSSGIILLSLPVLMALAIQRVFLLTNFPTENLSGFLFPAGVIGMLGVIFINPRIAFAQVVAGVLLFGLAVEFNLQFMVVGIFGGFTALLSLSTVRERWDVRMAAFHTSGVNLVLIIVLSVVNDPTVIYLEAAAVGILNGLFCVLITLPSLSLFENMFGIVTDVKLLELTGINKPLLREMEDKIPGTYQHSMNVAKLAEPAARAIEANYLLVRAGAYYHDIGKMLKSRYYSENQVTPEEKQLHNNISPNMSMLIVRNHVKEGMELAKKKRLPQKIIDFIPQHHGTSLINYFYKRAQQQYNESESNVPVREEDFRYLGPKPQSVEAAIVMLADAVEATATSRLSHPNVTEDEISRLVHETIVEKFNDGQMDECPLTLRDLHVIRESFVKTLKSRFHFRVDYPSTPAQKDLGKVIVEKSELKAKV